MQLVKLKYYFAVKRPATSSSVYMMVVVKYTLKRFLRLKYQPAVILEDTVEGEMTSPTALHVWGCV